MKMLRRHSLERRLFGWLLAAALVPVVLLLAGGTWLWSGALEWVGTLGPWDRVAVSGQGLIEAAGPAAAADPALAAALERHRSELSESVVLARRWAYVGERVGAALPALALLLGLVLSAAALAASRRLARQLARPIRDAVDWAERLGREEPLPAPTPAEADEVREVRALRAALRAAAASLVEARQRALELERVRAWGEMARRVAHEMKNPLTPLRLAVRRVRDRAGEAGALDEPLAVLEEETARLEALARRFAALGRPPDGPRSAVDLAELLGGLLETDVPPSIARSLEVAPGTPYVLGHYEGLVRAFRNLVRNAVEALPGEAPPRIDVRVAPVPDGRVEVRLADTGRGLPAGAEGRLFEPDFTTKSGGAGLGLALVRQAVTADGGEVVAVRRAGGAEFVVRLPVAPARDGEG